MKKRIFSLFIVFLLLFVVGCQKEETKTSSGKAFVGGTQGLVLSFLPSQPPAEIYDKESPFQVGIKIENKGEYNIENANDIKVKIDGINPSDFKVSSSDLSKVSEEPLDGVSLDSAGAVVSGEYTTLYFPEMNYFGTVSGTVDLKIRANVCYEYGTKAQGLLCVRKDLQGRTTEAGICNPDRQVPAQNSGAPIQIENIRQNVAGSDKIDFAFTIKKISSVSETLHRPGTSCSPSYSNIDYVYVQVEDTGLGELKCSGLMNGTATSGYVQLQENSREIRCTQKITTPGDFEKVVKINLKYGYKQFIDTPLKIRHVS